MNPIDRDLKLAEEYDEYVSSQPENMLPVQYWSWEV
jgi:hypothetical protein